MYVLVTHYKCLAKEILMSTYNIWVTSWENLFMPYANNKGADQPAWMRSLISAFVFHCLDSIIPLVFISLKLLRSFCGCAGQFQSYRVADPENRFSHDKARIFYGEIGKIIIRYPPYLFLMNMQIDQQTLWSFSAFSLPVLPGLIYWWCCHGDQTPAWFLLEMTCDGLLHTYHWKLSNPMRLWYLSHRRPVKAQASLRGCAVSTEPSLFAHMKYGSGRRVRPKIRHLAQLDGCACAFEEWVYGGRKVP